MDKSAHDIIIKHTSDPHFMRLVYHVLFFLSPASMKKFKSPFDNILMKNASKVITQTIRSALKEVIYDRMIKKHFKYNVTNEEFKQFTKAYHITLISYMVTNGEYDFLHRCQIYLESRFMKLKKYVVKPN